MFKVFLSYESSIANAAKGKAEIQEYRSLKFLSGKYQAKLYDNDGNFVRDNIIVSRDYKKAYDLNSEVTVAYRDGGIEIIDHLTPLYFSLGKVLIIFFILMFLSPFLPIPNLNKSRLGAIPAIALGSILIMISTFHYQQQTVFEEHSGIVTAQVIGYHVDTCEDSDDDEYTCYARKLAYTIDDRPYTFIEKVRRSSKKGNIGDRVDFIYLKGNPSEGQLTSTKMIKSLSLLGYLLGSLCFYGGYRMFTKGSD